MKRRGIDPAGSELSFLVLNFLRCGRLEASQRDPSRDDAGNMPTESVEIASRLVAVLPSVIANAITSPSAVRPALASPIGGRLISSGRISNMLSTLASLGRRILDHPLHHLRAEAAARWTARASLALAIACVATPPVEAADERKTPAGSSTTPDDPVHAGAETEGTTDAIRDRRVSLDAERISLRRALTEIGRQAGVSLEIDEQALEEADVDLDAPADASFSEETLQEAMAHLITRMGRSRFVGAYWEIRDSKIVVSTLAAKHKRTKNHLPDWLVPHYGNGLLVELGASGEIVGVTAGRIMTDELIDQLATLPRLADLHIEMTDEITEKGVAKLGNIKGLQRLSLCGFAPYGKGLADKAIRSVVGLDRLVELSFIESGVTDEGVRFLEQMRQLKSLELRQEGRLTDAALRSIGKLEQLTRLNLASIVATESLGRMRFSAAAIRDLSGLQQLRHLDLTGHPVPSDALTFSRLTSLSLGGQAVDDACAEQIAACRDLKSLSLMDTGISDDGLEKLATIPTLRCLNFSSHIATDAGIAHLTRLERLQELTLRMSRVTDDSLKHIALIKPLTRLDLHGSGSPAHVLGERFSITAIGQLTSLPRLRTLRLSNFRSQTGYRELQRLNQLRVLSIFMCDISSSEVRALKDALPNTLVQWASGGVFAPSH